jgi:hypothetical protein
MKRLAATENNGFAVQAADYDFCTSLSALWTIFAFHLLTFQ